MGAYSTNQNRQFYVANTYSATPATGTAGVIGLKKTADYIRFPYVGGDANNVMSSDAIPLKNITYAKLTKATAMVRKLKCATVTISANDIIAGETYFVGIKVKNFLMNDETSKYLFSGYAVAASSSTKKGTILGNIALNLFDNLSTDANNFFKVFLGSTEVTDANYDTIKAACDANSATYANLAIHEIKQPFRLGACTSDPVDFEVYTKPAGDLLINNDWATIVYTDQSITVPNSEKVADMEYFYNGERGDMLKMTGFPNNIDVKYIADPKNTAGYDLLDIHYFWQGDGTAIVKSEKSITVAMPTAEMAKLVAAIGSDVTISTIPAAASASQG